MNLKYLTRVAINISLTRTIKIPILKRTYINNKCIPIDKMVIVCVGFVCMLQDMNLPIECPLIAY